MRSIFTSLALLAGLAVSAFAEDCEHYTVHPYEGGTTKDPAAMKQLTAYWAKYSCFKKLDNSEPNMKEQCKDVCFPSTAASKDKAITSSQTCDFGGAPWTDARTGNALLCGKDKNFQGVTMKTGYCSCDSPILEFAGNFFIEGVVEAGKILEKFICPALQALDIVMAIGMAAIPPRAKQSQVACVSEDTSFALLLSSNLCKVAAARSAKAYKYAYEAQDAAQEWADFFLGGLDFAGQAGCPPFIKPSKEDLITKAFDHFSNTPDDVIPGGMNYDSLPCPKKGCTGCKGPNCRGQNNDSNNGSPKSDDQPANPSRISPPETRSPSKTTRPSPSASTDSRSLGHSVSFVSPSSSSPVGSSYSRFSSSSSSTVVATTTLSCKALAALGDKDLTDTTSQVEPLRRSYPVNIRSYPLEKRGEKSGKACGIDLKSFSYPSSGGWKKGFIPKKYGFNDVDSCDDYNMDNPDTKSDAKYETEHVLEWQIVAGFFNQMNKEFKKDFVHPDPDRKGDKVDFCEYWKELWQFHGDQLMPDPRPNAGVAPTPISKSMSNTAPTQKPALSVKPTPGLASTPRTRPTGKLRIPSGSQKGKPFGWLASAYPHKGRAGAMWVDEFTLLERTLNGEVKAKVFSQNTDKDGNPTAIRSAEKMEALVEGRSDEKGIKGLSSFEQGRKAVQRLRQVTGTVIYMQDKDVAKSFANEKNRLGKFIGYIDKELHKTPRIYFPDKTGLGAKRTALPWQQQDLENKWYKYMDGVFEKAKTKATKFMDTNLSDLKKEWDSNKKTDEFKTDIKDDDKTKAKKEDLKKLHKNMLAYIEKTNKEWDKVKNWQKPSNWAQVP